MSESLKGRRILVVEDLFAVAEEIAWMLEQAGCEVVGPTGRLSDALGLAREERLDGAVLDVDLGGDAVTPVAEVLADRGVPMVFATGFGARDRLPPRFASCPRLQKPFRGADLHGLAQSTFAPPAPPATPPPAPPG